MKNEWNRVFVHVCVVLSLTSALAGEEKCSVEIKLLLSSSTIQAVIASLSLKKETAGQVYFFDTDALDLQKQGVIVRVRQGASNDLTVKVRVPEGGGNRITSRLRSHFSCEINWTGAGEDTDYSVKRSYKTTRTPETGKELLSALTPAQKNLLRKAQVSVDWSRVRRIASINATNWESASQPLLGKLTLELWRWPAGNVLEISSKAVPNEGQSKYEELQHLIHSKNLSLNASQGSKTSMVLETLTHQESPAR